MKTPRCCAMLSGMQKKPPRPRDPNQLGKLIVDLSVGEVEEEKPEDTRDPAAVALGSKGGKARAKNLTEEQKRDIARLAADARWKKSD